MIVKIQLINDEKLMPVKKHEHDAAFDIRSAIATVVLAGETKCIPVGFKMEIPPGYEAQLRPRSGLALHQQITMLNSPGTIDAGYRGEVGAIIHNAGKRDFVIEKYDRIGQMVIMKLPDVTLLSVTHLSDSDRGANGLGSSGVS